MRLQVSENEILSTITRSLAAIGWPPGNDNENAKNAVWLENHGLEGLRIISKEIFSLKSLGYCKLEKCYLTETEMIIADTICSSIRVAQMAMDSASIGKNVTIKNCSGPLILFAEAARRSKSGESFYIECYTEPNSIEIIAENGILHGEMTATSLDNLIDVSIKQKSKTDIKASDLMPKLQKRSCPHEVKVDTTEWEKLVTLSRGVLVATSVRSRLSAGAGADDNF